MARLDVHAALAAEVQGKPARHQASRAAKQAAAATGTGIDRLARVLVESVREVCNEVWVVRTAKHKLGTMLTD
jgi:hypothetical protein